MEFGGPGLASLSPDERATLANMATECSAKAGVVEADEAMLRWIAARRPGRVASRRCARKVVAPDPGARVRRAASTSSTSPRSGRWWRRRAIPASGIPSDPTNGACIADLGDVPIDIAYGGSCTAGKEVDLDLYARGDARGARRRAGGSRTASTSSSSSARSRWSTTRARRATSTSSSASGRARHPSRLRRLHRLRPGRLDEHASR